MKKNMGNLDRIVRIVLAIGIAVLYFQGIIGGLVATILMVLAVVFMLTSFVSICPLYALVGLNTCPRSE